MASTKIIIVTGANRGIGLAICNSILSHPTTASSPITLYATSRSGDDLNLTTSNKDHKIIYKSLDISDSRNVVSLKRAIQESAQPVDVLINNAGVHLDSEFSEKNAATTIDVNYRGTLKMCRAFIPLMRAKTGRIVNLSSVASSLKPFGPELQPRFRNARSLDEVEGLALEYQYAVHGKTEADSGWPSQWAYTVSKALINSMTKVLARDNPELLINCCCPGWIKTGMGNLMSGEPPKEPEDGAKIPVKLALSPIDGITGCYWANDSISSTDEGKVQEW